MVAVISVAFTENNRKLSRGCILLHNVHQINYTLLYDTYIYPLKRLYIILLYNVI